MSVREDTQVSVKVSKRHQIVVPRRAREQLNIRSGDRLLVDIQDGLLILLPRPTSYTEQLAGRHKDVWEDLDTAEYTQQERDAWTLSAND